MCGNYIPNENRICSVSVNFLGTVLDNILSCLLANICYFLFFVELKFCYFLVFFIEWKNSLVLPGAGAKGVVIS